MSRQPELASLGVNLGEHFEPAVKSSREQVPTDRSIQRKESLMGQEQQSVELPFEHIPSFAARLLMAS